MMQFFKLVNDELVPCDMMEWSIWHSENDTTIAYTKVDEIGLQVSTVFLGFGHGINGTELFETMTFNEKGSASLQQRYCTLSEARAGHDQIVKQMTRKLERSLRQEHGEILATRR